MPITHSTIFITKFKLFFFNIAINPRFFSGWFIIWPEGTSYAAWQNMLKSNLSFIGSNKHVRKRKPKNRKKLSRRYRKFLQTKILQKSEIVQRQTEIIIDELKTLEPVKNEDIKIELITMLRQFCERKHISQHIEEAIPDRRNKDLITYSKQSIMMCALAIFLFRMESGNKFDDKSHDRDEKYSTTNMAKFINAPEDRVPVIKTIENFLKNLEEDSVNKLMITFFKDLQESKFFKQHPQIMPGDFFLLAADCVHTHTYDHPHHTDKLGNNDCQCCLKRVYNKGTEKETVRWLHNTLVFCFVFMGGLKIPVYRYSIHAKQVVGLENVSEENHKQECELVALKIALPMIRKAFPKMKIVLLLDGLYANRPTIKLAKDNRCGYIIVRKESCLPSLAKECNEHETYSNHKKNCTKRCQGMHKEWLIEQKYSWFNSMYLGDDLSTNVLRFYETRIKEGEETEVYKCEWLFSWRLSGKSCELAARLARSRWEVEDLFNSVKRRGFNFKHDYSRDPRSCFNWHGIALFAFGIFELFRFSEAVKKRSNLPQITLAEKLQGQLLYRPTDEIFSEKHLLKRVQFRYHFVVELILLKEAPNDNKEKALRTG
jgi:hypothetical protein